MSEVMQRARDFAIEQVEEPVGYADYLLLAGIYKQAHPELERGSQSLTHLKETLDHLTDPENPNTALLVARDSRARVVGAAMLYVMGEPESGRRGTVIEEIFVDKRVRGQSIGKLLLDDVMQIAKERGSGTVLLGPEPQTPGAKRLFANSEFTENKWGKLQRKVAD